MNLYCVCTGLGGSRNSHSCELQLRYDSNTLHEFFFFFWRFFFKDSSKRTQVVSDLILVFKRDTKYSAIPNMHTSELFSYFTVRKHKLKYTFDAFTGLE